MDAHIKTLTFSKPKKDESKKKHSSFQTIPSFYRALPKENELIKLWFLKTHSFILRTYACKAYDA